MNSDNFFLKSPLKAFMYAIRERRARLVFMLVCIIIGNAFAYADSYVLKIIVDKISGGAIHSLGDLTMPLIYFCVVLIGAEVSYRIGHFSEISIVLSAFDRITSSIYKTILDRPIAYFEDKFSGELNRRVEQISNAVKFFIESFPWEIGWPIIGSIMTAIFLSTVHPWLFWIFIVWLVVFVATSYVLLRLQYKLSQQVSEKSADLSGTIVDVLGNASTVHTFAAHDYEDAYYRKYMDATILADRKARWMFAMNKLQQGSSIVILSAALVFMGIELFLRGEISVGGFVIIGAVLAGFPGIIWTVGETITRATVNIGEFKNALESLGAETTIIKDGDSELEVKEPKIVFENMGFSYPRTKEDVIKSFNLVIEPGERVGLVGRSGAGKSTIVKLLLRSYDPTSGAIKINGRDIRSARLDSLRKNITFVPQDTSLFHRSLYENILYARPEATHKEILEASVRAHAHEFIDQYPSKYDTLVGERGVKLSGGQRQRIALARAMLKNSPILVLDEATSSLDTESEEIVQQGLQELFKDRTVLAIAHRLSTLRSMDRIIVLDKGRIVEDGSPKELLAKKDGTFKEMWERQKNGFV